MKRSVTLRLVNKTLQESLGSSIRLDLSGTYSALWLVIYIGLSVLTDTRLHEIRVDKRCTF